MYMCIEKQLSTTAIILLNFSLGCQQLTSIKQRFYSGIKEKSPILQGEQAVFVEETRHSSLNRFS